MDSVPPVTGGRLLAAVFLGGAAGALARAGLAEAWAAPPGTWPWATFAANLAGAALLGAVEARVPRGRALHGLLAPGLSGALTTFSTFQVELVLLVRGGHVALAAGYAGASLALGIVAVGVGRRLA